MTSPLRPAHHRRISAGVVQGHAPLRTEATALEESVALDAIGCVLALRDGYDRVF